MTKEDYIKRLQWRQSGLQPVHYVRDLVDAATNALQVAPLIHRF
jgi:hypothetical protein